MPTRTGYCSSGDLILGKIPFPSYMDKDQVIAAAADEMDSYLGFVYQVPIKTEQSDAADPTKPIAPVVALTLKRINYTLASGRVILQLASPQENTELHAYGASLVAEALSALKALQSGSMIFENIKLVGGTGNLDQAVPLINNLDSESNVEAFYDRIANPGYSFYPGVVRRGDGYLG